MEIKINSIVKLPTDEKQINFDKFKVFSILFYQDNASFDAKKYIEYNASFLEKIKWLFSRKPIKLKKQIGVKLVKEK